METPKVQLNLDISCSDWDVYKLDLTSQVTHEQESSIFGKECPRWTQSSRLTWSTQFGHWDSHLDTAGAQFEHSFYGDKFYAVSSQRFLSDRKCQVWAKCELVNGWPIWTRTEIIVATEFVAGSHRISKHKDVHPPKSMMLIVYSHLIFKKITTPSISTKYLNFPLLSFNSRSFCLIYVFPFPHFDHDAFHALHVLYATA